MLALFADSTNIDRRGFTGPEIDVIDAFEELFTSTQGKLVVATFSSSIYRMQVLVDLAAQFDRKVAFVGRSIVQNAEIAQRLGYLRVPAGVQIRDCGRPELRVAGRAVPRRPARRASRRRRCRASRSTTTDACKLGPDDTVVLSARAIPGNEKAIARMMSHIARRGADVVTDCDEARARVGTWQRRGAEAGALARAAALLRAGPRRVPPAVAARAGRQARDERRRPHAAGAARARTATSSSSISTARASPTRRPTGRVLIDVTRVGEVGDEVLRDRRHLAGDGVIVAVVAISRQTGALVGEPEMVARGFVVERR